MATLCRVNIEMFSWSPLSSIYRAPNLDWLILLCERMMDSIRYVKERNSTSGSRIISYKQCMYGTFGVWMVSDGNSVFRVCIYYGAFMKWSIWSIKNKKTMIRFKLEQNFDWSLNVCYPVQFYCTGLFFKKIELEISCELRGIYTNMWFDMPVGVYTLIVMECLL